MTVSSPRAGQQPTRGSGPLAGLVCVADPGPGSSVLQAPALALCTPSAGVQEHVGGWSVEQRKGGEFMRCWVVSRSRGAACACVCGGWRQSFPLQQHPPLASTMYVPPRVPSRPCSGCLGTACCRAGQSPPAMQISPRHWQVGAVTPVAPEPAVGFLPPLQAI
jgi:hypothetical protein